MPSPSITSATAVYSLSISTLFPTPINLQGFSADNIFGTEPLASAEVLMGLDGYLSGGFVYVPIVQNVELQADSDSNQIFEQWWAQQQVSIEVFVANGVVTIPAINRKWAMTRGFLTSFPPMPDAAKTLRPRRYGITWNKVEPAFVS